MGQARPEGFTPRRGILFMGFGDSSLDFELRAFTQSDRGRLPMSSDLGVAIHDALDEAGITIPFPQRDLHLKTPLEIAGPSRERGDG